MKSTSILLRPGGIAETVELLIEDGQVTLAYSLGTERFQKPKSAQWIEEGSTKTVK
jgi:hypothetical protein